MTGQDLVRAFDRRDCGPGSERTLFGHQYRQRVAAIVAAVLAAVPEGAAVADLGCAQGNLALALAGRGRRVTAVDRDPDFLAYARSKPGAEAVEWVDSEIQAFRPPARFAAAVLAEVIEHTGSPDRLLDAVADLLEPGGTLVLTTPNGERLGGRLPTYARWRRDHPDPGGGIQFGPAGEDHRYLLTRAELRGLVAARFEPVRLRAVSSAAWNRGTAPLLRLGAARALLDRAERLALAAGAGPRLGNQWLLVAERRA